METLDAKSKKMTIWNQKQVNKRIGLQAKAGAAQTFARLLIPFWGTLLVIAQWNDAIAQDGTPENRIVTVVKVVGENASVQNKSGKKNPLKNGNKVNIGDTIETGNRSVVSVVFYDKSLLTVGQNSRLLLSELKGDPQNIVHWNLKLLEGAVRGDITNKDSEKKKEDRGIKMTIESPIAAMGVRGTKFVYTDEKNAGNERTTIYTEQSEVVFSPSADFKPDKTVAVSEGNYSYLENKMPKPMTPKKFNKAKELDSVMEKYDLLLAERAPQSVDAASSDGENPKAIHKKLESIQNCIDRKQGWRQSPETSSPMGECY